MRPVKRSRLLPAARMRRRLLLAGVIVCVMLVMLLLTATLWFRRQSTFLFPPYPVVYASPPADMPTVRRAPAGSERDVRVKLVTVGTRVNNMSCAHWVSATLAGQSITTAGFGKSQFKNDQKLPLVNDTISMQNLRDWDVVIYLDQDTLFTGTDLQPFIDDFIRRSPAHPDDINVREIRRGAMVGPLRFASDPGCWAPTTSQTIPRCEALFNEMEMAVQNRSAYDDFEYLWDANISFMTGRGPELYLNSGFYMARVWAFRELLAAQTRFTAELPRRGTNHYCDQSIYTALYLDLRWGELKQGLLGKRAHEQGKPTVNQFGLHYGLIDIWRPHPPVMLVLGHGIPTVRIDASAYGLPYQTSMFSQVVPPRTVERTVTGLLSEIPAPQTYIRDVPLGYGNEKGYRSVRSAPSLIGISPRLVDQMPDGHFPSMYPAVLHFADRNKDARIEMYLPLFGWHIAMRLEPDSRNRTVDLLRSTRISVMNSAVDALDTITLGAHCQPWIDRYIVQGLK